MKKILAMVLSIALVATMAITGSIAYLQDTDSAVNVMTMGNVYIDQHEYERVVDKDGNYEKITTASGEGYKLQEYTQGKPLYPSVGEDTGYGTSVYFDQLGKGAAGGQAVLEGVNNIQDKFVLVENTGKTEAYVRTIFAYEMGSVSAEKWDELIEICACGNSTTADEPWKYNKIGVASIDEKNYYIIEAVYTGYSWGNMRHNGGILPAGEYTYNSLAQIYMSSAATNEDCKNLDGNNNGMYDILVVSQAVQTAGFPDAKTALDTAFGVVSTANNPWVDPNGMGDGKAPTTAGKPVATAEELKNALAAGESVIITDDISVTDVMSVSGDVAITLSEGASLDASSNASRPFELAAGSSLTINAGEETVKVGAYGLVNIPAGNDANVVLNGGKYIASTDNGSFIKPRGAGEINITLNNVSYVDNGTGAMLDDTAYTGDALITTINGGSYKAPQYMGLSKGSSVKNATIELTSTKTNLSAIEVWGDATIENCTVIATTGNHGIAVSSGATATIKNCTVQADSSYYVFSSGGTLNISGSDITYTKVNERTFNITYGSYTGTAKVSDSSVDAPAKIIVNDSILFEGTT